MSEWIKPTEQLPSKHQWVLVTINEDYQHPVKVMRYMGVYVESGKPAWTSGWGDIKTSHPDAWMPLPEPYKESGV